MSNPVKQARALNALIPAWLDGELTPVEKINVHQRGLRHMAVSVFIMCGEDLLIQRRALSKYHTPGLWANTCCTHPHWGEAPEDCAVRRLGEELGIAATAGALSHRQQIEYRADVGGGLTEHELVDVYMWRVTTRVPLEPNPEEVMDTEWLSKADLERKIAASPDAFTPWLKIYMDQHAEQIFS